MVDRELLTTEQQPSTINHQPSTINDQRSTINDQPSTINIHNQPSTINHQPSTINHQRSTIHDHFCYTGSRRFSFISSVTGFTQGLKHNQLRRIERLATRRVPPSQIVSQELARQMSELSLETGRQIGVL